MTDQIAFQVMLDSPFEAGVEQVTAALKAEGFGVLTTIDVKATLKEKLDEDFRPYTILGACNPPLAHRALSNQPLVGLMLPCNVTVEQVEDGKVRVSIVNPDAMLGVGPLAANEVVCEVASDARTRLERVAQFLREGVATAG